MNEAAAARSERVFLDVGAHGGATAADVLSGGYRFDRVISVEPDPEMVAVLTTRFARDIAAGLYAVAPVALSDQVGEALLFGDNAGGGASLIASKFAADARAARAVRLVDWPAFAAEHRLERARLWIKINAEGAEVAILDSLLATGGLAGVESLAVDFDIVKTPFGGWKKWSAVRRLRAAGAPLVLTERVFPKHGPDRGVANWLRSFPDLVDAPRPPAPTPLFKRLRVKYLECVSALGVRHDAFKRRRPEVR